MILREKVLLIHLTPMDSIACWNVRGLNKTSRQLDVKSFLLANNTYLVGLLETKVSSHNKNRVMRSYSSWNMSANYDASSHGRIWVLWQPNKCSVHILEQSSQFMHCEVDRKSVV